MDRSVDRSVDPVLESDSEESTHRVCCERESGQRNEQGFHYTGYAYPVVLWEEVGVRVVDAATLEGVLVGGLACVGVGLLG